MLQPIAKESVLGALARPVDDLRKKGRWLAISLSCVIYRLLACLILEVVHVMHLRRTTLGHG